MLVASGKSQALTKDARDAMNKHKNSGETSRIRLEQARHVI